MDTTNDSRDVIGRSAEIQFVDFSNVLIPAKVDTGAYRSAIHATNIYVDENKVLHFRVLGNHPVCNEEAFDAMTSDYSLADVTNSFGDHENRYKVNFRIKIGEHEFETAFTLADRSRNIYPILLGRVALKKRFIVDIDQTGVDRAELKEKYNINLPEDEELAED